MSQHLHPLLLRQLRRVGLEADASGAAHAQLLAVLERISRAYTDADQARYLLERSQEVASREMTQLYNELKASQSRLASLVSLSSDWIWEQDTEQRFCYVSAHSGDTGSRLSALLTGKQAAIDLMAVGDDNAQTYSTSVAARQPFRNITFRASAPDGDTLYLRISGEPMFDGDIFRGWRGVGSDVTQATVAEQQVLQLARYDGLTGLPNRSMFMAHLELALNRARANEQQLALFFIDLDRFKMVNDSLGHAAGDNLLQVMAQRLSGLMRDSDLVARLGGDEFVVLLDSGMDTDDLCKVARRMLTVLSEPLCLSGRLLQVSASIGIGLYPADGTDVASLLKSADTAMYLAKSRGKNNFQFFTAELAQRASRHFTMESELRQAAERGELRLHYQPRYELGQTVMCGMEALLRWQHPQRGLLGPGAFIELAEESGLIVPIGRWVLEEACRQIRQWREIGLNPPRCAVNLSVRQFSHEAIVDEVRDALAQAGLEPAALEVEITESLLMADTERAQDVMHSLHELGIRIAIDDFGTGYSSLAYLKRFQAQTLKIDRSFVQGLPDDRDDAAITQAVIAMAHSLGMQVVAEGVETQAQLEFLRLHGCDEVQGFLLARPLPPELLADLLLDCDADASAQRQATLANQFGGALRPASLAGRHAWADAGADE